MPSAARATLLHDFEFRSLGIGGAGATRLAGRIRGRPCRRIGWLGRKVALREDHALAGLPGVDAENRTDRDGDRVGDAREARLEGQRFVAKAQSLGGAAADVEDDLAVLDELPRHADAL